MGCHITVVLASGTTKLFELSDRDLEGLDSRTAQEWLGAEFDGAGCTPTNPVGKLLLADKILVLAKTVPPKNFENPTAWVQEYLRATACALGRPAITIDLARHALGY